MNVDPLPKTLRWSASADGVSVTKTSRQVSRLVLDTHPLRLLQRGCLLLLADAECTAAEEFHIHLPRGRRLGRFPLSSGGRWPVQHPYVSRGGSPPPSLAYLSERGLAGHHGPQDLGQGVLGVGQGAVEPAAASAQGEVPGRRGEQREGAQGVVLLGVALEALELLDRLLQRLGGQVAPQGGLGGEDVFFFFFQIRLAIRRIEDLLGSLVQRVTCQILAF
ncbi:K(+)/H(+) antiporter NhaP2 [Frankliniella fusca]|uniref:K(+)/H(+) antiporter NhaP2 n=1 Tax=Frankliniella fusca TaxID=407009 RepID=A0AAE1HFE9_9NEOP|nr:K(+)/H(+) antiporter NhaP2 [Frankliniella fusca]